MDSEKIQNRICELEKQEAEQKTLVLQLAEELETAKSVLISIRGGLIELRRLLQEEAADSAIGATDGQP